MRSLIVSGAAMIGPVRPAALALSVSCGSASTAGERRARPSAAMAPAEAAAVADLGARDGAHDERLRGGVDGEREGRRAAAEHVEGLGDVRAQHLVEITTSRS